MIRISHSRSSQGRREPFATESIRFLSALPSAVKISEMNLGRSVAPENWDQKRAMSKGRSRRDLELNKYIEVVKARFLEIHNMLVREGGKDGKSENTP